MMEENKKRCKLIEINDENCDCNDSFEIENNNTDDDSYGEISESEESSDSEELITFSELTSEKLNKIRILSFDDIQNLMDEEIEEIQNVTKLSKQLTKLLLNNFNWDKIKLLDRLYEIGEDQLIKSLKIEVPSKLNDKDQQMDIAYCQICLEADNELLRISCGHGFCKQCWQQYLALKIIEEGCGDGISCPAHKCHYLLDENMIISTLTNQNVRDRYKFLLCNNYIIYNRLIRFCPEPKCNRVIKTEIAKVTVQCTCGLIFCFQCGIDLHEPVMCETVIKWEQLSKTESLSSKWIHENTKNCPSCKSPIQKNGGCNHMNCPKCKFDFCWACLKRTKNHNDCQVNVVDGSKSNKTFDADFVHYLNLYKLMEESIKFEKSYFKPDILLENPDEKHWICYDFIEEAVNALYQNRRVLMNSYVFLYFIDLNTWKTIFEENLEALRRSTESLSALMEREISMENVMDMKQKTKDLAGFCESRRKILVKFVADGYQNGYWKERKSDPSSKSAISIDIYKDVNKAIEEVNRRKFGHPEGQDRN
ncbi:E3 ubiquitin-protein ligase ariadne-1-like [Chironomus tepperi]|uniref:E3 ubiquitin-protein ligase ariadne-1-like n=1 Tax=Chironomus tepperi TaxID=113505 RepID=UPI00391EF2E6